MHGSLASSMHALRALNACGGPGVYIILCTEYQVPLIPCMHALAHAALIQNLLGASFVSHSKRVHDTLVPLHSLLVLRSMHAPYFFNSTRESDRSRLPHA